MANDRAIFRLFRRITAAVFALVVGLSLSVAGALNDPENDSDLVEEVKVTDSRSEIRLQQPRTTPTKVVIHTHVFSSGDHLPLPHLPLASGHCLVNGLRAPLRC